MKISSVIAALFGLTLICVVPAHARSTFIKPYVKKYGTYVGPGLRTSPDHTKLNNYSTKGNVNPYSGRRGTVDPYKAKLPRKRQ